MATETIAKETRRQRAVHELGRLAIITAYLYVTLGAVILYKAAVLHDQGISFVPWGLAAVKAVLLAKFLMLGGIMKVGRGYTDRPLIWPTLYKSFVFLVLLVVLTTIEEIVVGLFRHQSVAASLDELFGPRLAETMAGYLIMLLLLIPLAAIHVLNEALGEGRLVRMFFVERRPVQGRSPL